MAKKREPMTDEILESYMKETVFYRQAKNYFGGLDEKNTKRIKNELEQKGTYFHFGEEIEGDITIGLKRSANSKKLLKDYTFQELFEMGAITFNLETIKKKKKLSDADILKYTSYVRGNKQLNLRPTDAMSPETKKRLIDKALNLMQKNLEDTTKDKS